MQMKSLILVCFRDLREVVVKVPLLWRRISIQLGIRYRTPSLDDYKCCIVRITEKTFIQDYFCVLNSRLMLTVICLTAILFIEYLYLLRKLITLMFLGFRTSTGKYGTIVVRLFVYLSLWCPKNYKFKAMNV